MQRTYNGQRDEEGRPEGLGVLIVHITEEIADVASFRYSGEFLNEAPHGQGVMTFSDGSCYVGQFRKGAKHGLGLMINADGEEFDSGYWMGGKFIGGGCEMPVFDESGLTGSSIMQMVYDSARFAEVIAKEECEEDIALQDASETA